MSKCETGKAIGSRFFFLKRVGLPQTVSTFCFQVMRKKNQEYWNCPWYGNPGLFPRIRTISGFLHLRRMWTGSEKKNQIFLSQHYYFNFSMILEEQAVLVHIFKIKIGCFFFLDENKLAENKRYKSYSTFFQEL